MVDRVWTVVCEARGQPVTPRVLATCRIPDDAGRRYATVSGDVNPIHLSGLTAKAFGFKRAIARHVGGGTRAGRPGRLPDALGIDVGFRKPLFLPSAVTLATGQAEDGWDVAVRNPTSGTEHLVGTVRPA